MHYPAQHNHLVPEHSIFGFKSNSKVEHPSQQPRRLRLIGVIGVDRARRRLHGDRVVDQAVMLQQQRDTVAIGPRKQERGPQPNLSQRQINVRLLDVVRCSTVTAGPTTDRR